MASTLKYEQQAPRRACIVAVERQCCTLRCRHMQRGVVNLLRLLHDAFDALNLHDICDLEGGACVMIQAQATNA